MFKFDKAYLLVILILGVLALYPLAPPTHFSIDEAIDLRFGTIPFQIGDWVGKDEPVDELTYQILETKNILSRLYQNPKGEAVHLLLVGSSKDRRVAHPPEVCYTSSHYTITETKDASLPVSGLEVPVKRFTAHDQRNPNSRQEVLYLYKVGKRFTTNYYAQQLQFAWDNLTRQESQILLIRFSGTTGEPFQEFLAQILPHLT
ncbi:MAG: EpsI family protein [Candidatus Omnitrophica bacterium]|nr:EpsI family protein [Candidatus Omnitrophota bacterium]